MTRLLIVTQVVDQDDPALGFFCTWLAELSKHFDRITVITLKEGTHSLPQNVTVYSLGKEHTPSRLAYVYRFYSLITRHRARYDVVFVHMNQEYVLLGGLLWRLWGKKVTLWRNHYAGSSWTRLAGKLAHTVFCTSKSSYTARFANTVFMPVGVSLERFAPVPGVMRDPGSILWLGRLTPAKRLEVLFDALEQLGEPVPMTTICGDTLDRDRTYVHDLRNRAQVIGMGRMAFVPGVPNHETPRLYSAHGVFVNTSPSGMFDKTMLEAMLCGAILVASSRDLVGYIDARCIFSENDPNDLAQKLKALLALSEEERTKLWEAQREYAESHSLERLGERLRTELTR